jgi:alkylation response protein AidB-like acyl-CoA dehydrogenase
MDFALTDDQRLLTQSVARLLADHYGFSQRQAIAASADGWSAERWADYAALGLLGLTVPEADNGFGGGPVEMMLVMQEFGRALVLEPFLASAVLGGTALRLAGHRALLPGLLAGTTKLAFAYEEPTAGPGANEPSTARQRGSSWELDGQKILVLHGAVADYLVVAASVPAGGSGLFLVAAGASGLSVQGHTLVDSSRSASVQLRGTPAERLAGENLVAGVVETGLAAICAEAVGVMESAYALTVEYLNTRQQFGRPIGRNQALQHRLAEMLVGLEQARSMAMLAAMSVEASDPTERSRSLSQARVQISRSGRLIAQSAIQLHGGIGVTEEYAVGHALRRLMVLDQMFGNEARHLRLLADAVN